jgi:acyl-CoA thioester hydrolase
MAFKKDFTVRWSEIDPNMHLTSAAYVKYITDTRMNFFEDNGFGLREMKQHKIGPIVLSEKSYYFKEIHPGEPIQVRMSNAGVSENGGMMRLEQRIYNEAGENCFLAYTLMAFIDVVARKMTTPPDILREILESLPKSERFKVLSKQELRDSDAFPESAGV